MQIYSHLLSQQYHPVGVTISISQMKKSEAQRAQITFKDQEAVSITLTINLCFFFHYTATLPTQHGYILVPTVISVKERYLCCFHDDSEPLKELRAQTSGEETVNTFGFFLAPPHQKMRSLLIYLTAIFSNWNGGGKFCISKEFPGEAADIGPSGTTGLAFDTRFPIQGCV